MNSEHDLKSVLTPDYPNFTGTHKGQTFKITLENVVHIDDFGHRRFPLSAKIYTDDTVTPLYFSDIKSYFVYPKTVGRGFFRLHQEFIETHENHLLRVYLMVIEHIDTLIRLEEDAVILPRRTNTDELHRKQFNQMVNDTTIWEHRPFG